MDGILLSFLIAFTLLLSLWAVWRTQAAHTTARDHWIRLEERHAQQNQDLLQWRHDTHLRHQEMTQMVQGFAEKQQSAYETFQQKLLEQLAEGRHRQQEALIGMRDQLKNEQHTFQLHFEKRQTEALQLLQATLQTGQQTITQQVSQTLEKNTQETSAKLKELTHQTDTRLKEISGQVDRRLAEGFEKTNETFARVVQRLVLIDEAQKKITELSCNVISLQEILSDKKSRGAFGEVQLQALVRNLLPETAFEFQSTLSNNHRADCLLKLPSPAGNLAIDSKFPLESYQRMTDSHLNSAERMAAEKQFKTDIKKHIGDIAERYILPGETGEGAVMFLPAEAVFAEIHAHHRDLVEEAFRRRVWITSPTTLMAILSTARAVLKDEATRQQVHLIRQHLMHLSEDFERFQKRIDSLARHVRIAHEQAEGVSTSAGKITNRFRKIEKAELVEALPASQESHEETLVGSSSAS